VLNSRHYPFGMKKNSLLVQFHPSYIYEDFFEGFRPQRADNGELTFEKTPGPFCLFSRLNAIPSFRYCRRRLPRGHEDAHMPR